MLLIVRSGGKTEMGGDCWRAKMQEEGKRTVCRHAFALEQFPIIYDKRFKQKMMKRIDGEEETERLGSRVLMEN